MPDDLLDRIAAADRPAATLERVRVAALGKSGAITALLKSLGAMDPDDARGRSARRSTRCARRSPRRSPSARRRSKPPSSNGGWRPRRLDLSLPAPDSASGTVHPVSQVMDELAEIFADLGFAVAEGPEIEDAMV